MCFFSSNLYIKIYISLPLQRKLLFFCFLLSGRIGANLYLAKRFFGNFSSAKFPKKKLKLLLSPAKVLYFQVFSYVQPTRRNKKNFILIQASQIYMIRMEAGKCEKENKKDDVMENHYFSIFTHYRVSTSNGWNGKICMSHTRSTGTISVHRRPCFM